MGGQRGGGGKSVKGGGVTGGEVNHEGGDNKARVTP